MSTFLVYRNRFDEVKPYEVDILVQGDEDWDVMDLLEKKRKTFKVSGVLSQHDSYAEALSVASVRQGEFSIQERKPFSDRSNRSEKFEVCFTGFPRAEKEKLIADAKSAGLFVRTDISENLGLLVCGPTAGPSKLKKANDKGIPRVFGGEGFANFLQTGEYSE